VNILLVDDHPANLVALEAILEPLGQRLVKATSGQEALRCLLHEDFACMLLDVQMPGLDGLETARLVHARESTRHLPIIFLSASSRHEAQVLQGYGTGAVDYVLKPLDAEVLRAKVRVFVELARRERKLREEERALRMREHEVLERERQQTEERLRRVVEASGTGTWEMDLRTQTVRADARLLALFGLPPDSHFSLEIILRGIHAEDRDRVSKAVADALAGKDEGYYHAEYRTVGPGDGRERWVEGRGQVLFDSSGKAVRFMGTGVDITARKTVEFERERLLQELAKAVRLRDTFLAVASHELKTPLTPLALRLAQLKREARAAQSGEHSRAREVQSLEIAEAQVKKLAVLVDGLLDVSRIAEGRLSFNLEEVDVSEVVRDTVSSMEPLATRAGTPILMGPMEKGIGRFDPVRLGQVVSNLLSNALKYGAGKPVHVAVESGVDAARLVIRDEGIGIEPEDMGRIFGKFERAVSERHYGGLGLGLYLTRQIVEAMGGFVKAESAPGQGATFTVELPLTGGRKAP
jgi:PAS domain S-box-containing protein